MHPDIRYFRYRAYGRYHLAIIRGIRARLEGRRKETSFPYKEHAIAYGGSRIISPFWLAWHAGFDHGTEDDLREIERLREAWRQ